MSWWTSPWSWAAASTAPASRATSRAAALKVVLCEQDDLAQATSSSSTKLIHGGLRYLEYNEFALVRKALAEREVLLRSAPHIMWPLRFVMPHDPACGRCG
jgi:glycerol-3-phosphate dehydrogenase